MTTLPATHLAMLTLVKPEGQLELSLARRPLAPPKDKEVVVKVQAAPINPSDLGLMVGGADITTARGSQWDGLPVITASVPLAGMRAKEAPRAKGWWRSASPGNAAVPKCAHLAAPKLAIGRWTSRSGGSPDSAVCGEEDDAVRPVATSEKRAPWRHRSQSGWAQAASRHHPGERARHVVVDPKAQGITHKGR